MRPIALATCLAAAALLTTGSSFAADTPAKVRGSACEAGYNAVANALSSGASVPEADIIWSLTVEAKGCGAVASSALPAPLGAPKATPADAAAPAGEEAYVTLDATDTYVLFGIPSSIHTVGGETTATTMVVYSTPTGPSAAEEDTSSYRCPAKTLQMKSRQVFNAAGTLLASQPVTDTASVPAAGSVGESMVLYACSQTIRQAGSTSYAGIVAAIAGGQSINASNRAAKAANAAASPGLASGSGPGAGTVDDNLHLQLVTSSPDFSKVTYVTRPSSRAGGLQSVSVWSFFKTAQDQAGQHYNTTSNEVTVDCSKSAMEATSLTYYWAELTGADLLSHPFGLHSVFEAMNTQAAGSTGAAIVKAVCSPTTLNPNYPAFETITGARRFALSLK